MTDLIHDEHDEDPPSEVASIVRRRSLVSTARRWTAAFRTDHPDVARLLDELADEVDAIDSAPHPPAEAPPMEVGTLDRLSRRVLVLEGTVGALAARAETQGDLLNVLLDHVRRVNDMLNRAMNPRRPRRWRRG